MPNQQMPIEAIKDNMAQEAMNAEQAPRKINEDTLIKAQSILQKYKDGKTKLEAKIIADEEFWKLRQWRYTTQDNIKDFHPATAYLWSCIQSRYSDAMDSYPTCNFLARQEDDKAEAKKLSSIVPVVLEQNRYEETYSDIVWYMLKHGGCVQAVFWDGSKHNGLGDIAIKKIDFINLFWQPGITNIQDSRHLFNTELVDNEILEQRYPQCVGKLGSAKTVNLATYLYDDQVDTKDKSVVVDWYYHTEYNGKKVLQYVKFVNNILLYATENETQRPQAVIGVDEFGMPIQADAGLSMAERGLYDHGLYPFVCQALYPVEGNICGFGLTDIGRDTQIQIDVLNKAITDNAIVGSKPRYFKRGDGGVNEEELLDTTKPIVHVNGNVDDENLRPIDTPALPSIYVNVLDSKVNELKYVTSNQDSNNGVAPSGVTAASAIAALQETAGKNARSSNKAFHRAYREVCYQIVELIRQFYDVPRTFRIAPNAMGEEFITYSNENIMPQLQLSPSGADMGFRLPEFDIEVTSEKASPYKKMEQNELALNFYQQGFFNPQNVDQALACLEMMDFNHKEDMVQMVKRNGTMQELLLMYQQMALELAQKVDPVLADQLANQILASNGQAIPQQGMGGEVKLDSELNDENPMVEKSRERARESTTV